MIILVVFSMGRGGERSENLFRKYFSKPSKFDACVSLVTVDVRLKASLICLAVPSTCLAVPTMSAAFALSFLEGSHGKRSLIPLLEKVRRGGGAYLHGWDWIGLQVNWFHKLNMNLPAERYGLSNSGWL